jgi:hypothetical protein
VKRFDELKPGDVLDEEHDVAAAMVVAECRKNTKESQMFTFHKVRTVKAVQRNRTYTYVTFESYAVVRRVHNFKVEIL